MYIIKKNGYYYIYTNNKRMFVGKCKNVDEIQRVVEAYEYQLTEKKSMFSYYLYCCLERM